jgi:hypothetical protein
MVETLQGGAVKSILVVAEHGVAIPSTRWRGDVIVGRGVNPRVVFSAIFRKPAFFSAPVEKLVRKVTLPANFWSSANFNRTLFVKG